MRIFHELVMDEFIEGATGFFPPREGDHWFPIMGHFEMMRVMLVVDHVSGSNVALSVNVWEAPDMTEIHKNPLLTVIGAGLIIGQTNILQGSITPDLVLPATHGYWMYVGLSGDASPPPIAHVRMWVTGRGRA